MIVVADDLGSGSGVDDAILEALSRGLVDAASILVNGLGFEASAEQARPFAGRLGVHLVLTEGVPLTREIRSLARFCDSDGLFRPWRGGERAFRFSAHERAAVAAELRAQVTHARAAGIDVAHLDSHHHVHTEPAVAAIVVRLARELGVRRVRLARNCGPGMGPANRAWKAVFNAWLRRSGLAGTRWFGSADDYVHLALRRRNVSDIEIMVHPIRATAGFVADDTHPDDPLAELLLSLPRR